jgi:hypothetical protein
MSGSGFALLGYAPGPNLRRTTNERQDLSTDAATGFGVGSVTELGLPRRLSAQCAAPDAYVDTMIVVVTY